MLVNPRSPAAPAQLLCLNAQMLSQSSSEVVPENRAVAQTLLKFGIQIDNHAADRSRTSAESHCNESTSSKISLDSIGCFDLSGHISGDHGSEVAFYQGSHDQTAGARIVRASGDPWLS
jgi:hypothetical protein